MNNCKSLGSSCDTALSKLTQSGTHKHTRTSVCMSVCTTSPEQKRAKVVAHCTDYGFGICLSSHFLEEVIMCSNGPRILYCTICTEQEQRLKIKKKRKKKKTVPT